MAEKSRFWDGLVTGDASEAPYDASTEFAEVMMALSGAAAFANKGGVFRGALNALAVSSGGANLASIATGIGQVYGTWHQNDAAVSVAIPTPGGSTRVDRIVLRKSWASQTVRITRIAGTPGAGTPAMTQTLGTTWDVPLATVSITTGGVMTFTDGREYLRSPLTGEIVNADIAAAAAIALSKTELASPSVTRRILKDVTLMNQLSSRDINYTPVIFTDNTAPGVNVATNLDPRGGVFTGFVAAQAVNNSSAGIWYCPASGAATKLVGTASTAATDDGVSAICIYWTGATFNFKTYTGTYVTFHFLGLS